MYPSDWLRHVPSCIQSSLLGNVPPLLFLHYSSSLLFFSLLTISHTPVVTTLTSFSFYLSIDIFPSMTAVAGWLSNSILSYPILSCITLSHRILFHAYHLIISCSNFCCCEWCHSTASDPLLRRGWPYSLPCYILYPNLSHPISFFPSCRILCYPILSYSLPSYVIL